MLMHHVVAPAGHGPAQLRLTRMTGVVVHHNPRRGRRVSFLRWHHSSPPDGFSEENVEGITAQSGEPCRIKSLSGREFTGPPAWADAREIRADQRNRRLITRGHGDARASASRRRPTARDRREVAESDVDRHGCPTPRRDSFWISTTSSPNRHPRDSDSADPPRSWPKPRNTRSRSRRQRARLRPPRADRRRGWSGRRRVHRRCIPLRRRPHLLGRWHAPRIDRFETQRPQRSQHLGLVVHPPRALLVSPTDVEPAMGSADAFGKELASQPGHDPRRGAQGRRRATTAR